METKELVPVEYSAQRVVTTAQLAEFYDTETEIVMQNFRRNADRFIESKHYFKLEGELLKEFKATLQNEGNLINKFAPVIYLWTKRGCARHAKMLGTEKAWEVFEELEENYFKTKDSVKIATTISARVQDVVTTAKILEEYLGLKRGIAFTHTLTLAEKEYGIDLTTLKALAPPAEHSTGYMNPTDLAKKLGVKNARELNKILETKGYQTLEGTDWRLTDKGKEFAEEYPYSRNGHSGYQIRWSDLMLVELEKMTH